MMTYDSKRQRVVLLQQSHAGRDGMEVLEWDGQQWTRFEGPVTPRIRGNGAWCYDAVRGVCVLFGGHWWNAPVLGDTWLWDGRRWTEVNTATSPPARFDGKSCFDASLGRVVMFGGEGRSNGQPNLLGDLWSFDGSNWGLESSGGSGAPVPRNLHAVFYDTLVGEVVLFGGYVGNNAFVDDTWSWRRSQGWRRLATNGAPSPRGWHSVAFDTNRGRGILYGQYLGWNNEETWEWGSSSRAWTLLTKAPPGGLRRQGVAMTWDGAAVVLYGGIANYEFGVNNPQSDLFSWNPASKSWSRSTPSAPHGSRFQMATDPVRNTLVAYPSWESSGTIWERSGGVWKSFVPTSQTLPSGRWYPALASDGRGGVILFGGERGANFQNDAWRFDGTTWMPVAAGPSARSRVAAVGTPWNGGTAWFYGGRIGTNPDVATDELWAYTTGWSQVPKTGLWPPAVEGAALAYDPVRDRVVLFGGRTALGDTSQTWEWNGTKWTLVNPVASPPPTNLHRMCYDPRLKRCLAANWRGEVWGYDGTTWNRVDVCEPPGVGFHIEAGLGFDPVAQETVLLSDAEWVLALDDTALFETYGVGCPAADEPRMQSTMRPILGATMDLDAVWSRVRASLLMIGSSRYKLGAVDLPIDLSGLGVDGCWLQTSAELNVPPTSVSTNNHARYRLAIPNDLALRGKCVYAQALVLGLSSFGFTDGAVLRMGVR